ncbi:hypothetical protein [Paractinoplanes toevensis]|uniref:Uncharacterized protein n=1 Tax=Paractinoplanes toevensis TaxID=571911 RepID=A0A919TA50_9ACTN|nr:hypothetical protein [Actinoplanes toevensis]GIM90685.1 hypothetical protein Ato02nite_024780 [Actinoplanes toevensis]
MLLVLALALTGCSSAGDRGTAAAASATGLLRAVAAGDGSAACALLAPETVAEVAESAEKPCSEAILEEKLPAPGRVLGTAVYGQRAQVRLDDDTMFLGAFAGGWRVVAAGCTGRGEQPYDCVVEAG